MRIVVIGQAAFGAKALDALVVRAENIVGVFAPPDSPQGRFDPLKEAALAKRIPVYQPENYKGEPVHALVRELKPDLIILAFVTQIIPQSLLDIPGQGAICYHPSLLPRHRGASAINWAIIMGDTRTGLTIFWVDSGIDTGPILLQKETEIYPDDTTGSVYFSRLFPMGVEAIAEAVGLIRKGRAPQVTQPSIGATYEPPCTDQVAGIDWQQPAAQIYNLIRGCDPQPGAYALRNGEKLRLFGARFFQDALAKPSGTVVEVTSEGLHIAIPGGRILVSKVRPEKGGKMAASDWAQEAKITVGEQLASAQ